VTGQVSAENFIANMRKTSRDHSRTPMQWDDSPNGGFTSGTRAWLAVNPNYREINTRQATADRQSIYHYFRQGIALRREHPALIYGDYQDLDPSYPSVFAYTRTLGGKAFLIVLNFSGQDQAYTLPGGLKANRLVLSNRETTEEQVSVVHLKGWEARVYGL
jgi:oligo-1,6-glucosidase